MESKRSIDLDGSSLDIVKQCGPALCDIIHSKFGCVAEISAVDFESGSRFAKQKRPVVAQEQRVSYILPVSGVKVSVWKADLTSMKVDAVVNAANKRLQHGGGLAQALSEAGGSQIQRESDDYIRKYGPLATGDAVITSSGFLPCNMVIHAVGPDLPYPPTSFDVSYAKRELEMAINNILCRVDERCVKTVAIPAISSGLFNYPLPDCAETIVSTVRCICENSRQKHRPTEIMLVNHDDPTVKEMEKACDKILGFYCASHPSQNKSHSQATATDTTGTMKTSGFTIQIGNVSLTLKRDNLENQETDVIVNTASEDGRLNVGTVSSALLKKAGPGMQDEMQTAPRGRPVIYTKGYNLRCKEVYHTFCIKRAEIGADKLLLDSVLKCLQLAEKRHHRSIAFPAIGTGALGFTKKEAARIMCAAVGDFAEKSSKKMEVHFVIYHMEYDTFQAFEERMRHLEKNKSYTTSYTTAPQNKDHSDFKEAPAAVGGRGGFQDHDSFEKPPHISFSGPSEESINEAEKWLRGLFNSPKTITICNNFIQHFSEDEYRQLSDLNYRVSIEEFLSKGHACLTVNGTSVEDVRVAALQVEAMLCNVQKRFVIEEENEMISFCHGNRVIFERKRVDCPSREFSVKESAFKEQGLWIIKMDKVENLTLGTLFGLKKHQLNCHTPELMFQRIPAQFCEMVSHIGFHAEFAPPEDPVYGEGIYFAKSLKTAMKLWRKKDEEYLYFVEAEVLTGKSTPGQRSLIMPPALNKDPQNRYDSVTGGHDIAVIFSGYQAMPKYIITCRPSYF
ncbi:protein mono-ADP-ribosyltransferase PARP9 [Pholidichthys leucotaenia]